MTFIAVNNCREICCVKSVYIWSYSGPNAENTDQNNSKYGHFLRGDLLYKLFRRH